MTEMLEYIMQHYTLFFGGAILILLAIIGYYADKTNFGQGKNIENNNDKKIEDIENMRLSDIAESDISDNSTQKQELTIEEEKLPEKTKEVKLNEQEVKVVEQFAPKTLDVSNDLMSKNMPSEVISDNAGIIKNSLVIDSSDSVLNIEDTKQEVLEENSSLLNDEVFNKFDEEFNSILPKKEFINTDLLSDIDDLELGKTQKIDLSDVPDLDDIELPKIKQLVSEEQDIWKF